MQKRRRFQYGKTFQERLAEDAPRLREAAEKLPAGSHAQELLLRRVRQTENASRIDAWLTSPRMQSPKALGSLLAGKR
ncbi:hypothetical protein HAP48_0041645 [Bradyrhizobium septentrionale]|nr:hypothetical protein [Bradyrhizobium septentrionale]UGY14970.1 hypothetical protein HAP48_0041645 [Bradyrhizobium septentrionale]UGY23544.1 hypothetical protein HU675_0037235 [Bradyrhizobium septentrionale]